MRRQLAALLLTAGLLGVASAKHRGAYYGSHGHSGYGYGGQHPSPHCRRGGYGGGYGGTYGDCGGRPAPHPTHPPHDHKHHPHPVPHCGAEAVLLLIEFEGGCWDRPGDCDG